MSVNYFVLLPVRKDSCHSNINSYIVLTKWRQLQRPHVQPIVRNMNLNQSALIGNSCQRILMEIVHHPSTQLRQLTLPEKIGPASLKGKCLNSWPIMPCLQSASSEELCRICSCPKSPDKSTPLLVRLSSPLFHGLFSLE